MIQAQNISVNISGRRILESVDLVAKPGQLTAVIGPNGSGKTTLMKALCRDYAYTGTITLNGDDLQALRAAEAATLRAVLPQHSALPFPFTVREVVALGLSAGLSGVPAAARKRLPEEALARVDLDGFAGRFYGELSGGEQQRVQLARVLCQVWVPVLDGVPRYLFLDEPVSSLDIRHQLLIMDVARRFADAGGGVIAILHDLNLAAMYADAILALRAGQVAGFGTPSAVLTDALLVEVFDCPMQVSRTPAPGMPFVLPQSAVHRDGLQSKVA
ncbi:MAG TPA: heme ABC transporter ATP-binding protein [Devosia sp.]|nr:heme ABC transporter ATP-binding protein [Devosia sp.]